MKKYRDAETGQYVTEEYAKKHPGSIVGEKDKSKKSPKKKK